MRVYILLYNPRTENERIHAMQVNDRKKVLMFANEDDATRYGMLLEAQDFPAATIEAIDSEEVEAFCRDADFDCELVESGELAIPPEANLPQEDWDKPSVEVDSEEKSMSDAELEKIRRQLEGLL